MAYGTETKGKLRANYIKGMTLKAAATSLSVPYETARNWKRKADADGDDWDNVRAAHNVSKSGVKALTNAIIEDFVLMFKTTIDQVKENQDLPAIEKAKVIAQLSDSYAKTIKAAGDSNPKLSALAVAMEVLKKLAVYVRESHPDLLESYIEILEPFGEEISRTYS